MAIEQERRREAYELPLQELRNLAPDMLRRDTPTISPDLSPIEVCQIIKLAREDPSPFMERDESAIPFLGQGGRDTA